MTIRSIHALALAALVSIHSIHAAGFAGSVVSYEPGTGFATEFGTGAGYTNALAVLAEPSRVTPGLFGGPVDPFSSPYLPEQIVSIGAGGSLAVAFGTPIFNAPSNPFGLDFIIFGSAGFVITNGDFTGGGITDGSLFSATAGSNRVSVSADGVSWFTLDPGLAPAVDSYYPTDGVGDFFRPVNPALNAASFDGLGLDGIRALYNGSGGGTGFDIGWARDLDGNPVALDRVSFIRVDVLTDRVEIDGFAAVPEPGTWALLLLGGLLGGMHCLRKRAGACS